MPTIVALDCSRQSAHETRAFSGGNTRLDIMHAFCKMFLERVASTTPYEGVGGVALKEVVAPFLDISIGGIDVLIERIFSCGAIDEVASFPSLFPVVATMLSQVAHDGSITNLVVVTSTDTYVEVGMPPTLTSHLRVHVISVGPQTTVGNLASLIQVSTNTGGSIFHIDGDQSLLDTTIHDVVHRLTSVHYSPTEIPLSFGALSSVVRLHPSLWNSDKFYQAGVLLPLSHVVVVGFIARESLASVPTISTHVLLPIPSVTSATPQFRIALYFALLEGKLAAIAQFSEHWLGIILSHQQNLVLHIVSPGLDIPWLPLSDVASAPALATPSYVLPKTHNALLRSDTMISGDVTRTIELFRQLHDKKKIQKFYMEANKLRLFLRTFHLHKWNQEVEERMTQEVAASQQRNETNLWALQQTALMQWRTRPADQPLEDL